MTEIKRIAIDTSKSVFTLHAVDDAGRAGVAAQSAAARTAAVFQQLGPLEVALEACGGSHHWGRALQALGHRVRLLPPQYVKPFVRRSKNDRNDAEAICIAAAQPTIASVPVKSAEQQAAAMLLSVRELLVRQRTQLVNALRGHAAEMGVVAPLGEKGLAELRPKSPRPPMPRCRRRPKQPSRCSAAKPTTSLCGCRRSTINCCGNTGPTR